MVEGSMYTPGAGHAPPVLAGRDALLHEWRVMLNDAAVMGRVRAQDLILVGPRGVGKTVTVTALGGLATDQGFEVVNLQAVVGQAGLIQSLLQRAESRIENGAGPWTRTKQAFERVAGVSVGMAGFSAGLSTHGSDASGTSLDAGTLAEALATLATEVRRDTGRGGLLITVDEMQVASQADLALFAATLHRLNVDHPQSSVIFAGTGLPHTPDVLRKAGVTHPDRLFVLEPLPLTLSAEDAALAIVEPALGVGVNWHPDAVQRVFEASNGYPAHLQLFAHACWIEAVGPQVVTPEDVARALPRAAAQIETRTLGPRWERMPDRQAEFLAALAVNGGRASSGDLAATLGRPQHEWAWIRHSLIEEGDAFSPRRGHLNMAVPLFVPYILSKYEQARRDVSGPGVLLSLEQMRENLAQATRGLTQSGGSPSQTSSP